MLIKNIRLIDPATKTDKITDILIKSGKIKEIGQILEKDKELIDGKGFVLAPGLVDIHVHFRDPGQTHKEDIHTGAKSAAAGGFTTVVCMANTEPLIDNIETLKYFLEKAIKEKINIYTVAALTKGFKNLELTDMEELIKFGCVGFSDDGIPNTNTNLILEAMYRAKTLDVPISFHEEDPLLNKQNGINHGKISEKFGLYGAPSISEDIMVARDAAFCKYTGAKIDIQHISSGGAVDIVRFYKKQGADLHAEVTPHHFSLTEEEVLKKTTMAKMNPPLRTQEDREKIIEGLKDGTLSIIATDHAPHTQEEKAAEFTKAPSGIIGLETSLALGITNLVKQGHLSLNDLLEKMTTNPAKLYKLQAGRIAEGLDADLVIFNPEEEFIVKNFKSKSSNSPFINQKLYGKVKYTICKGKIVYKDK